MEITELHQQGATVALLTGKMDAESVPVFNQWLEDRIEAGQNKFVLDFGGISYLSSAGLSAVLSMDKSLNHRQGRLAICGLYGMARQVFQVSGLLGVLLVCPGTEESLVALQKVPA